MAARWARWLAGTYKINAHNQLGLTPALTLDFGGVAAKGRERHAALGLLWRRLLVAAGNIGVAWRSGSATHDRRWVAGDRRSSLDGRGTSDHLRGRSAALALAVALAEWTGATEGRRRLQLLMLVLVARRVAGRPGTCAGVIHWEALLRGRGGNGRGWTGTGRD